MGKNISDLGRSLNFRQATFGYSKIDMEIRKNYDRGHCHFLKSTNDIGDPPSRAPQVLVGMPAWECYGEYPPSHQRPYIIETMHSYTLPM